MSVYALHVHTQEHTHSLRHTDLQICRYLYLCAGNDFGRRLVDLYFICFQNRLQLTIDSLCRTTALSRDGNV
jgi:hypothetical protein